MNARILKGDCLEVMKTLPDKSIDLFVVDLPFGCLSNNRVARREGELKDKNDPNSNIVIENRPCSWDVKIDLEKFWIEVERLMKNDHTPIIHFCNVRFGYELIQSKEKWFRYDLVWNKIKPVGFLSVNKQPMRQHENIYVFSKKGATYYRKDIEGEYPNTKRGKGTKESNVYGDVHKPEYFKPTTSTTHRSTTSIIEVKNKQVKGHHPTEKPVDLYKFIIERYSKEGDTILDPTAGSFNSGIASKELNRNYIGIEMNEAYFNKATELFK